jgi:hypothetical protein
VIKDYLQLSQFARTPDFRNSSRRFASDRFLGWTEDPLLFKKELYEQLDFADIVAFYNAHLKNKPVVIMVVADKKRLNPKELEKFGKVEILKLKQLFN